MEKSTPEQKAFYLELKKQCERHKVNASDLMRKEIQFKTKGAIHAAIKTNPNFTYEMASDFLGKPVDALKIEW